MRRIPFVLLSFFLFVASSATASAASLEQDLAVLKAKLPNTPVLINAPEAKNWSAHGSNKSRQIVTDPRVPGGKATRIAIAKAGTNPWDVTARAALNESISKGDAVLLAFWARTEEANNEAQTGIIPTAVVELAGSPYTSAVHGSLMVGKEWTLYYIAGTSPRDYQPHEARITLHIGGVAQTLDLGPVYLFTLGAGTDLATLPQNAVTYPGREPDAAWRQAANERIYEHRMGDLKVRVTDKAGNPVPGATVSVDMQRHAYWFGAFIDRQILEDTPDREKMRESFSEMFNYATTPIYWQDWGWQREYRRQTYINQMEWLDEKDIPWRAHTVIYPAKHHMPTRLVELEDNRTALRQEVLTHVRDVMPVLARTHATSIDLINEPRTGEYLTQKGGGDLVPEAFRIAHEIAPDVPLFVNDFGILNAGGQNIAYMDYYHRWLDDMKAQGVPVGGIGFQGHFGASLTDPGRVVEILDDFSRHKLPIHITEFDIDTTDEEAQADYTSDILTAVFSHPSTEAFIVWGWWEGDHWRPSGAMLRKDWSPKPAYHAWMDRIYNDWWTNAEGKTSQDGSFDIRGFLGDYIVTVQARGQSTSHPVHLKKSGSGVTIALE